MPTETESIAGGGSATNATAYDLARLRELGPALTGYALPFLLIFYLALMGGGYDAIVRSQVGIAAWWIVLLGAAVGVLPSTRITPLACVGFGLLGAFAAWTALGISWSESSERSVIEMARVATLLGIFGLALLAQRRDGLRRSVYGVGAAIVVIGALALLSRLHPSWLPTNETSRLVPGTSSRLSYPLNYWNGVVALIAIGIPLVLGIAIRARHVLTSALAASALPPLALTAFYTFSRGGVPEIAVALIAFFALYPQRLVALPTALLGIGGSALLIAAATQRDALESGFAGSAAHSQGNAMIAITIVVCAGVALLQTAIALAARHGIGPRWAPTRRRALVGAGTAALVAVIVAIAAGAPGTLSDKWQEFKNPVGANVGSNAVSATRFESFSGNGRYQYWQSAVDANATDPLIGIGPGTFEYWWAQHGAIPGFVRDAHSLYLEALGELGIVGLVLIVGLVGTVLVTAAGRALRTGAVERRAWLATAAAGAVAFAVAAGIDWAWELTVLPVAFFLLAAAILGPSAESIERGTSPFEGRFPVTARVGTVVLSLGALVVIAIPMKGAVALRDSRAETRAGNESSALSDARNAADLQPYAATPHLQEALILELNGNLDGAAAAAAQATSAESTNWRTWLIRSRIAAEQGKAARSAGFYAKARSLNPRSPIFR